MFYKKFGDHYLIRLEKGEEIVSKLTEFCAKERVKLGYVQALGAVNQAVIGFFDTGKRKYRATELKGDHEITNLTGNITSMQGKTYLHLHVNLAGSDNTVKGGHLNKAIVSATCEMIVTCIKGEVGRFQDEELGLNLLDL